MQGQGKGKGPSLVTHLEGLGTRRKYQDFGFTRPSLLIVGSTTNLLLFFSGVRSGLTLLGIALQEEYIAEEDKLCIGFCIVFLFHDRY